ncbi:multidrug resistance protein [Lysobacter helvus]|uniref:Multidrug resistance protein n=2 Tax=Lysobacteraceae TaxID=32033 RepID=A0ABM7Q7I3_9GAMM|nr:MULTISPECIES: efflux RND transporter periplasmic adaptor subunit [Lysobacter]BCT93332.1 multidrug resistance protein [Lysobacter caseinilyticus]BCT96485.1 multidrug resistance protein [Lysobacter helvus]
MTTAINPPAPAAAPKNGKRKRALIILALVVLIAAIAWLLWYFLVARWHEGTDDAYVQGNIVTITPQTQGTVVSIGADDGMKVTAGQVLVQLDPNDARVAYEQAAANLANTVRQVRGLYSAVDANHADIAARRVAVDKAREDVARRSGLVATGAVSAEELAHARDELAAAEAALASSRENLSKNNALVDETTLIDQPQVAAAAAQLRSAYLNLERTAIVAPVDGYVAKRSAQLGQRVQPGVALLTVIPLDQVWVEANFKETQLAQMRIGQPVELHSDLYGKDVRFDGHLVSLGLGTGSAFALLPAQNASGNWIKIVQRVPVRISVDAKQLHDHPLRLGLSMHTDVAIRDQSGPLLAAAPPAKPLLATQAYAKQLAEADARIQKIVRANLPGRG